MWAGSEVARVAARTVRRIGRVREGGGGRIANVARRAVGLVVAIGEEGRGVVIACATPGGGQVTFVALQVGDKVIAGLALRDIAVVTAGTASCDLVVVKSHIGPVRGHVAGVTGV